MLNAILPCVDDAYLDLLLGGQKGEMMRTKSLALSCGLVSLSLSLSARTPLSHVGFSRAYAARCRNGKNSSRWLGQPSRAAPPCLPALPAPASTQRKVDFRFFLVVTIPFPPPSFILNTNHVPLQRVHRRRQASSDGERG